MRTRRFWGRLIGVCFAMLAGPAVAAETLDVSLTDWKKSEAPPCETTYIGDCGRASASGLVVHTDSFRDEVPQAVARVEATQQPAARPARATPTETVRAPAPTPSSLLAIDYAAELHENEAALKAALTNLNASGALYVDRKDGSGELLLVVPAQR